VMTQYVTSVNLQEQQLLISMTIATIQAVTPVA
jgi:hypothetical protein